MKKTLYVALSAFYHRVAGALNLETHVIHLLLNPLENELACRFIADESSGCFFGSPFN